MSSSPVTLETIAQDLAQFREYVTIRLDNLENKVNNLEMKVNNLEAKVDNLETKVDNLESDLSQTQRWQDRTWDVVKWVGGISAGLAVTSAVGLVGLFLRLALLTTQ